MICGGAGISDAFYCKERLELVRMVLGTFEMVTDSLPATESRLGNPRPQAKAERFGCSSGW